MISFQVQCITIVKRKASSSIEQQNCKGHHKRDPFLISKMEVNYQNSQFSQIRIQFSQIELILRTKCPY